MMCLLYVFGMSTLGVRGGEVSGAKVNQWPSCSYWGVVIREWVEVVQVSAKIVASNYWLL